MDLKIETYLPIGSVVILKGATQELMITGTCVGSVKGDQKKINDYLGCLWPTGITDSRKNFVFNQEDIDKVLFRGYEGNKS